MGPDRSMRIYVAGHRGLAGGAVLRELQRQRYTNLLVRTHSELDLEDARPTQRFFAEQRPEVVFLCAAKVGGILANNTYPADFLLRNLLIEANVIRAAHVGPFDERYRIAADMDHMLRLFEVRGVRSHYLPRVIVHMRAGGLSNRSLRNIWRANMETWRSLRQHGFHVGPWFIGRKILRKIPQLFFRREAR